MEHLGVGPGARTRPPVRARRMCVVIVIVEPRRKCPKSAWPMNCRKNLNTKANCEVFQPAPLRLTQPNCQVKFVIFFTVHIKYAQYHQEFCFNFTNDLMMYTLCRLSEGSEIASYLVLLCALQSQPSNLSQVLFGFSAVSRLRKLKKFLASGPAVLSCQSQPSQSLQHPLL